ncbi:MAG: hypothetical protein FWF97_04170 [Alphaproteobacteria bacterium]|nr:hypothetical protein [Alphaproteobacteria bacterium]
MNENKHVDLGRILQGAFGIGYKIGSQLDEEIAPGVKETYKKYNTQYAPMWDSATTWRDLANKIFEYKLENNLFSEGDMKDLGITPISAAMAQMTKEDMIKKITEKLQTMTTVQVAGHYTSFIMDNANPANFTKSNSAEL